MTEDTREPPPIDGEVWRTVVATGKAAPVCAITETNGSHSAWLWVEGCHGRPVWQMAAARESILIFAAAFASARTRAQKAEREAVEGWGCAYGIARAAGLTDSQEDARQALRGLGVKI